MSTTYEAVLRGNFIEWRKDSPQQIASGKAVNVTVTILDEPPASQSQGERMAAALSKLAVSQTLDGIDALAWERETRVDRPLPERSQ